MARLPGIADLGPAPTADATRPVGTYDATAIARGAAAIGQGASALGAGIAKVGDAAADVATAENRWQYSKAVSYLTANKGDLDAAMRQDNNYGPDQAGKTLPDRYTENLNAHRANAANLIDDPNWRALFMQHTEATFKEGQIAAASHARALSNDAQIAYVTEMGDKAIDQAVSAPDDATRTKFILAHKQLIDGLNESGAISDVQAVQMKQAWAHQYTTADYAARSKTDPQGVINELRAAPGSKDAIVNRMIGIEGEGKNARSSSSGLGGFTDGTFVDLVKRYRPELATGRSDQDIALLKNDRGLARDMLGKLTDENTANLKGNGVEASPGNIYLAHFLGPAGAAAVAKADPKLPVADVLAKAVGPAKAAEMIAANPSVLQGKLAGSVKQWADGLMGGVSPEGGGIHDMLRPDVREQLLANAQSQLQKQTVQDLTSFKTQIEDSQAEAARTGNVTKPLGLPDFISHLGADQGPKAYQSYQASINVARDAARVATMDPGQMGALIDSYAPKPGSDGYAAQAERQDLVRQAVAKSLKERADDPAGFAAGRLPGTHEAYQSYSAVVANPASTPVERAQAARAFASTTLLEQQGAGIPNAQRQILPAADVERFKTGFDKAANSDDPTARVSLIGQIQAHKAMWGDYWPNVVRQLAPSMQPMVRAIAADADTTAMTRLLRLDPKDNPLQFLKEQSETKADDLNKKLITEMAPYRSTLATGAQRDDYFKEKFNLVMKLAALYVGDGKSAEAAAHDAYTALIGKNYDIVDTFRVPKDSGFAVDDVHAGALAARHQLETIGARPSRDDIGGLSDARGTSFANWSRNGIWLTSPDESGLNFTDGEKFMRDAKGAPLHVSWATLAKLGGTPEARAKAFQDALDESGWVAQ